MTTIDVDAPLYTTTEAALAAGVTPKCLRNWIDRKLILLDAEAERAVGVWRKFSLTDVIRIAFVRKLDDFCVPIRVASELIEDTIVSLAKHMRAFKNPPVGAFIASYATSRFVLYEDGDAYGLQFMPGSSIDDDFVEKICHGPCAFVTIYPGPIVRRIVNNLGLEDQE